MKRYFVTIWILISFFAFKLNAQWSTDPTVNTAVTTAADGQAISQIVTSSDGGYIIVWQDYRSGTNYDIYAQKYNVNGVAQWTANGVVISSATGDQSSPGIVADASGGAIFSWTDARGANKDIYAQRINSGGTVQWTANGVSICTATGDQQYVNIVTDGSGGAIMTWNDNRGGAVNYDVYSQRINSSGSVQWTADGVAICTSAGFQFTPVIIEDGSGGAIIAWYDTRSDAGDIYAQKINSSGAVQWTADGELVSNAANQQYKTAITSDGSGGAIITWNDRRVDANDDIYAQRINSGGTVQWTANGVAICTAASIQTAPYPVADGSGGAVIAWNDQRSGGSYDVYVQKVNSSGAVQWTANGVAITTAIGSEEGVRIVSDGSGGAVVCFINKTVGAWDIYAQNINSSGTVQWTAGGVAICSDATQQDAPRITGDGFGGAVICWTDQRNGNSDIYAQYINSAGDLGVVIIPPTVTTTSISSIGATTAIGGGNVTDEGSSSVTARGICWSTSTSPTTANSKTTDGTGTGSFSSTMTGLQDNHTTYYVRAYATNSAGTSYGSQVSFTTVPTLPEWGLIALITLSAAFGGWFVFKRFV